MRSRSVPIAISVAVLAAAGAVGCYVQSTKFKTEAQWLLERGTAQGEEYAATLEGSIADRQLATFEERRAVLEQAHLWQRGQLFLILLSVIAAFSSYVLYLFARLRASLETVTEAEQAVISAQAR